MDGMTKIYGLEVDKRIVKWFIHPCFAESYARDEGILEYKVVSILVPNPMEAKDE